MTMDSFWLILKRASLNIHTVMNPPNHVTVCVIVYVCVLFTVVQKKYF